MNEKSWTILLLGALLVRPAAAQQETKVPTLSVALIPSAGLSSAERKALRQRLFLAALEHSRAEGPWQLLVYPAGPDQRPEADVLSEVSALIEKGKNQYRYLQLEEANKSFARARSLLDDFPPANCNKKQMAELYLYWGRTVLDLGQEEKARQLLQQILRFDPEAAPDPATMPPTLVATFDIAMEDWRAREGAALLVGAGPAQARVTADCAQQPSGVIELKGKDDQPVWLVVEAGGMLTRLKLGLEKGKRRSLFVLAPRSGDEAALSQAMGALREGMPPLENLKLSQAPALDGLARQLEVDLLQVAEVRTAGAERVLKIGLYLPGRGLEGSLYEVGLDSSGNLDEVSLASAQLELASAAASPMLLAKLFAPPSTPSEPLPPQEKEDEEKTPWYRAWWFWTAAGVLVAGAVAGGVAAALAGGDSPSGKVIITVGRPR